MPVSGCASDQNPQLLLNILVFHSVGARGKVSRFRGNLPHKTYPKCLIVSHFPTYYARCNKNRDA